jgi:hypothetical protein
MTAHVHRTFNANITGGQMTQGLNINPFAFQQYGQPLLGTPLTSIGFGGSYGSQQPVQQLVQLLQQLPLQLQQLQQLISMQQQQLLPLQQFLHVIPGQLWQLQQLIHVIPQQLQHGQQPLGQVPGLSGFAGTPPWSVTPQLFGAQPGHVM